MADRLHGPCVRSFLDVQPAQPRLGEEVRIAAAFENCGDEPLPIATEGRCEFRAQHRPDATLVWHMVGEYGTFAWREPGGALWDANDGRALT